MSLPTGGVGVGVIGLGFGERVHLPGWASLRDDGVKIAAVCAPDADRAAAAAERFDATAPTTDWRGVVADPAVSIVSIATPPTTHVEIVTAALRAGKAVLCEKPLGVDAASARSVADDFADGGPPALVDFSLRALPELRRLQGLHAKQVRVTWHVETRDDSGWPWSWKDSAAEGGGALALYGVHIFDYIEWLFGSIAQLQTTMHDRAASRVDKDGTERRVTADESFDAHLVLEDGTPVDIDVSLAAPASLHRIEMDDLVLDLPAWPGSEKPDSRIGPFSVMAAELVSALREGRSATPSPLDGARALTLVEAARESARTGHVPIPIAGGSR